MSERLVGCECVVEGIPAECSYVQLGYPYCWGCNEHHRAPVATVGPCCPVDLDSYVDWTLDDPLGVDYPVMPPVGSPQWLLEAEAERSRREEGVMKLPVISGH